MSTPDTIVRQFGERAGISDLAFDVRGHVVFQAAPGRLLGMERSVGEVLIYVAHPQDYDAGDWLMRACQRAHYSRASDWPVQCALREHGDRLYLLALTRIAENEFTEVRLQQALDFLSRWLDALRSET